MTEKLLECPIPGCNGKADSTYPTWGGVDLVGCSQDGCSLNGAPMPLSAWRAIPRQSEALGKVRVLVTGLPESVMNANVHSVVVQTETDGFCGPGWRRGVSVKGEIYSLPKPDCDSCDYKKACVSEDDIDCDFCHKSEEWEALSERFESAWGAVNAVDLVLKVYGRTGADRAESVQRAFTELEQVKFQLDTANDELVAVRERVVKLKARLRSTSGEVETLKNVRSINCDTIKDLTKAIRVEREEYSKTRAKVDTALAEVERLKGLYDHLFERRGVLNADNQRLRARLGCLDRWHHNGREMEKGFRRGKTYVKLDDIKPLLSETPDPADSPPGKPLTCDGCTESTPGTYQCGRCVGKASRAGALLPGPLGLAHYECGRVMNSLPTFREKHIIKSIEHLIDWAKKHC